MEYTTSVLAAAPPEVLWGLLVDVEGWPGWTQSVLTATRLDDGPFGVGSRTRVQQPRGRAQVWTVTELVPNQRFTWEVQNPGLAFVATHVLTSEETGTRVDLGFTLRGPLRRLGALVGRHQVRAYLETEAAGLKARAEHDASAR